MLRLCGFRLPPLKAMVREEAVEAMHRALLGSVSTKVWRAAKGPVRIRPRINGCNEGEEDE